MTIGFLVVLLGLGAFVGFAAGLLGIGGGMVLVPFLNYMLPRIGIPQDLAVHAAIATAMGTIVFTSLSSIRAHQKRQAIHWDVVRLMVPGIILGGFVSGGAIFSMISNEWLAIIFVAFVYISALRMLRKSTSDATPMLPPKWVTAVFGFVVGVISGLLGAGGGFLSVPYLARANIVMARAVATSAALGFFIALANSIGYIWSGYEETKHIPGMLGYNYWPALITLSVMSVLTAPLGAAAAHRLPVNHLKRIFAGLLFILGTQMIYETFFAHA